MTDKIDTDRIDHALEAVDVSKRSTLRKMVVTTAFAAPIVASFAIDGMLVSKALAQEGGGNSTLPSIP